MSVFQIPDLRRQPVNQIAIMRNQQDGALEVFEHFLQHFLRGDVQMVGGFVQQQEVRPFQRQPSALAAAQHADLLENRLLAEQKLRQMSARVGHRQFLVAHQFFQHRVFRDQLFVRLGKIADIDFRAGRHRARQRFDSAHDRPQEGGLASAVGTDQRRTFQPVQIDLISGEQRTFRVADLQRRRAQDDAFALVA